ncbi:replication initiator protein A [Deinococcus pimensis]|uniref:replication initiator protein A n=1 Tax=Deinococcus pimensis TaxID=309888 RepID=UPI0004898C5C|nr:replication initiator protein A [Deinococcus pimensis]
MSRKRRDNDVARGIDERNIAGIALIPSQKYLPRDKLVWTRHVTTPTGKMVTVTCKGMPDVGLPRGVDGDILVSLLNAYVEAGCPADGVIVATPYAVLRGSGMGVTSVYYEMFKEGLERLKTATYTLTDGWYEAREMRFISAHFNLLNDVQYTHGQDGLDERSVMRLQLSDRLTKSIRDGHVKPLNLTLYRRLPTVGARTLYRLLDLHLFEAAALGEGEPYRLTVPLVEWGAHCGILDPGPDKIRRALDAMHKPLLMEGYLQSVAYSGTGRRTEVRYVYGQASAPARPEHVEALLRYGVHRSQAEKYARELGEDVLKVIDAFETHKRGARSRVENEARYLAAMLKDAESILQGARVREAETAHASQRSAVCKVQVPSEEADGGSEADVFSKGTFEEMAEYVFNPFHNETLRRSKSGPCLELAQLDRLRSLVALGEIDARETYRLVLKTLMGGASRVEAIETLQSLARPSDLS